MDNNNIEVVEKGTSSNVLMIDAFTNHSRLHNKIMTQNIYKKPAPINSSSFLFETIISVCYM